MDTFTRLGAQRLQAKIRHYWWLRGYTVNVTIKEQTLDRIEGAYVVRSDMRGGLPRDYKWPTKNK